MATGYDGLCLPLKFIINTVKSLVISNSASTQLQSGEQMATGGDNLYLPPEIITNILKRLPVKSLVQFQSVCKDWRNLQKSPSFIVEHYDHSAHENPLLICYAHKLSRNPRYSPLCLLRYKMETVQVERIPAMDSLSRVSGIVGSSNGLLCLKLRYEKHNHSPSLLLMNPATREVRQVPTSRNHRGRRYCLEFGFCPVARDYKIVIILNGDNVYVDRVEVFSLRTGSWKEVECGVIRRARFSQSVTVNGFIFWLGWEGAYGAGLIISFDLSTEVFTLIPLPSSTSVPPPYLILLVVYDNKVAIINQNHAHESYYAYESAFLWVLEEGSGTYGKSWSWTKKYKIRPTLPFSHPICLWENEIVCDNFDPAFLFNLIADNDLKFPASLTANDRGGRLFHVESLMPMSDMCV